MKYSIGEMKKKYFIDLKCVQHTPFHVSFDMLVHVDKHSNIKLRSFAKRLM